MQFISLNWTNSHEKIGTAHVQNCDNHFILRKRKEKESDLENCLEHYIIFKASNI